MMRVCAIDQQPRLPGGIGFGFFLNGAGFLDAFFILILLVY
jgi:hypothetical protein